MGLLDWLFGKKSVSKQDETLKSDDSKFTAIGNTEPLCPYCNFKFDNMPQQKKQCPNCKNFLYSRTRPLDNKKVLIKGEQIDELERQWMNQGSISPLKFNLVSSHAVVAGKVWREKIIKSGGSDVTEKGPDGVARRVFNPWLANATPAEREQIADIITSSIETGKPLKVVARELKKISAMHGLDADLVAYQETRFLFNKGTFDRFAQEDLKSGIWHHMDPQENPRIEHQELNGKEFPLGNPIWNELYLEECKCWCEPVIPGMINGKNKQR
jgi:hypothetical protein